MMFLGKQNKERPLFVAEIGAKFTSYEALVNTVRAAKEAGADFAKIQYYTAEDLVPNNGFEWEGRKLFDIYKESEFPKEWLPCIFSFGEDIGIPVFSSVYSLRGLEDLENEMCPAYKISSFENENRSLIEAVEATNKPYILSAGMLSDTAVYNLTGEYSPDVLMHCVSKYPCPLNEANLDRISYLGENCCTTVGYSDHVNHPWATRIATCLGAEIIEKHFAIIPTESFAYDAQQFKWMIEDCERINKAICGSNTNTELYEIKEQRMIGKERI